MYDKLAYLRLRIARLEKLSDLNPPLGSQNEPCYILERARNNGANIPEVNFVKEVLENLPMKNHSSGRRGLGDIPRRDKRDFYRLTYPKRLKEDVSLEPVGRGRKKTTINITGFTLSSHAQFRMDQRGVNVDDIEMVLRDWQRKWRKANKAQELKEQAMQMKEEHDALQKNIRLFEKTLSSEGVREMYSKLKEYNTGMEINHKFDGTFVGFVPQRDGSVDIKTVFNLRKEDEKFNC